MPLQEYVLSVRTSSVQQELYDKYLQMRDGEAKSKGAQLFSDYQALMRIWTHPWMLKLDEIRQENKVRKSTCEFGKENSKQVTNSNQLDPFASKPTN